jgi:pimeloyl-ACP methyl ester carboxylesterase
MAQSVVLVHGLRTSATMWRYQVEELERLGIDAIAVDLPGHGARMGERFSLDGAAETIAAAVESASGDVFVCGFSLGGYVAMHYAGAAPRPITGLLLASCGTQPYRAALGAWRAAAAVIHRFPDRGLALNNAAVRLALRDPERANDVIAGGVALDVMADALRDMRRVNPIESLARIEQPVWLVNGQFDHFRMQERSFHRATRNGRLLHVPGATHMVSLARPVAFTEILLDALRDSSGEATRS